MNLKVLSRAFDVETYVKKRDPEHKHYGANVVTTCPYCQKPKLWVLVADRSDGPKAGAWQCFKCDERGGDAISLVRYLEDCSLFKALEVMTGYQRAGHSLVDLRQLVLDKLHGIEKTADDWGPAEITPVPLPDEFVPVSALAKHPSYLWERGIGPKKAARWGLGVCESGYFKNRVVAPVSLHGQHAFFVARWMGKNPPAGKKKVLYPKGAQPGRVLYNFDTAKTHRRIRIVEGVWDAVALGPSAVATFGTSMSQHQLELLLKTSAAEVTLAWDPDAYDKALALAERLAEFYSVRVVRLPDGVDPDELSLDEFRALESAAKLLDAREAFKARLSERIARA